MSPEYDTLDQLQGCDMPLALIRQIFPDISRFARALTSMLDAGDVRLLDQNGIDLPDWQWRTVLAADPSPSDVWVAITPAGATRVG